MSEEALKNYYNKRAQVYEKIYEKQERQEDLRALTGWLQKELSGRDILEIACGTGYWTQRLAPVAASIHALDQSLETMDIAREKDLPRVTLAQGDAFDLGGVQGNFTAGFAGFWWSHLPLSQISTFLEGLHARLEKGARVVFIDNIYVEGSSTPLARTDAEGNTYQNRTLPDGSVHEVLKNFPTDQDLRAALGAFGLEIEICRLTYYWGMVYEL